jgi:hypothetical protein
VLIATFFAMRSIPVPLLVGRAGEAFPEPPAIGTRSATKQISSLRLGLSAMVERLGEAWGAVDGAGEDDPTRLKLSGIRDEFRALVSRSLGRNQNDDNYAAVSAVFEVVSSILARPSGSSLLSPIAVNQPILPSSVDEMAWYSLQSAFNSRKEVDPRTLFVYFEFLLWQGGKKVTGRNEYEKVEIPLEIRGETSGTFRFLCCIDYNGNHFRTHVLFNSERSFKSGQKTVLPGMYPVDPIQQTRATLTAEVPQSSEQLMNALPNFRGNQFLPHLIV